MKISGQIEQIFAHAVALDQNGGLRNSIYAEGKEVYIMNYDHTVLLRFKLRDSETVFDTPVSFKANDYDSNEFYIEDNKIVFVSDVQGYERKKICGKAENSPDEIKDIFKGYTKNKLEGETLVIDNSILSLLDEDLSHIEFSGKKGESLKMIQRNIYTGGVIEISEKVDGLFENKLEADFGPVGIKTKDFQALFTFQNTLKFEFPLGDETDYIMVRSIDQKKRNMVGVIALCLYDELIQLKETNNGR